MKRYLAQFVIIIVMVGVMAQRAAGAEPAGSVNLGFGGIIRTMPHCDANVYLVEYEHLFTPATAILGRVNKVDYKFDDGNYREDGTLRGLDIGVRHYPAGAMRGFFTGGSLGRWNGDWTFILGNEPVLGIDEDEKSRHQYQPRRRLVAQPTLDWHVESFVELFRSRFCLEMFGVKLED